MEKRVEILEVALFEDENSSFLRKPFDHQNLQALVWNSSSEVKSDYPFKIFQPKHKLLYLFRQDLVL